MIVPLLIVWLGYGEREATGTSMMAIVVIAAVAVTLQAFYGNVDPPNAALVGIPAIGGRGRRHGASAAHPRAHRSRCSSPRLLVVDRRSS